MKLSIHPARTTDANVIAALRTAAGIHLTGKHGRGHWSSAVSEKTVLRAITTSRVLVARSGRSIVGTLTLETKKPWAIDTKYFTPVSQPLYLHAMAVDHTLQRTGIGRRLCEEARAVAQTWPAGAIRLDAYDAKAGAGGFYAKCGFREVARVTYRRVPLIYYELLV